jgi:YD repeat-containing protein
MNFLAESNLLVGVLGSVKSPKTGRIWFNYPGQGSASGPGNIGRASKIVRRVEGPNGSPVWTMSQTTYNDYGLITGTVDPKGRAVRYTYHANEPAEPTYTNNLDIHQIQIKDGANWVTVATYGDPNAPDKGYFNHQPMLYKDELSGVETQYHYRPNGQVEGIRRSSPLYSILDTPGETARGELGRV